MSLENKGKVEGRASRVQINEPRHGKGSDASCVQARRMSRSSLPQISIKSFSESLPSRLRRSRHVGRVRPFAEPFGADLDSLAEVYHLAQVARGLGRRVNVHDAGRLEARVGDEAVDPVAELHERFLHTRLVVCG